MKGVHTILGARGSGKTRLAQCLCREANRLLVADTLAEHTEAGYVPEVDSIALRSLVSTGGLYRIGFVPFDLGHFEWGAAWASARRGTTLLVDEINFWYPTSVHQPGKGINDIAKFGRHYEQSLVLVTQQASTAHPSYRGQGRLWVFPMRERGDCKYVMDVTNGFDPKSLSILERDGDHILTTELACVDGVTVKVWRFDLVKKVLISEKE